MVRLVLPCRMQLVWVSRVLLGARVPRWCVVTLGVTLLCPVTWVMSALNGVAIIVRWLYLVLVLALMTIVLLSIKSEVFVLLVVRPVSWTWWMTLGRATVLSVVPLLGDVNVWLVSRWWLSELLVWRTLVLNCWVSIGSNGEDGSSTLCETRLVLISGILRVENIVAMADPL